MLEWADLIFIMDDQQRRSLRRRFAGHPTLELLICLDIPDEFTFMQPELVDLLTVRATPHLPRSGESRRSGGMRPARRQRTRHTGIRKRTQGIRT